MQRRSIVHSRALRAAAALVLVCTSVFSAAALASANTPAKAKPVVKHAPALASLKIQQAKVSIAHKGKKKFVIAKNGQVLLQGDSLRTDVAGKAEIDYTDGSLTRLGPSTVFTISKLTNKRGGRQTQGTLDVGQTWSRAAKVSETGSFEVKAGGTTAAVEGTAFAFACVKQGAQTVCTVIDVVDNVKVTNTAGDVVVMSPATTLEAINNVLGTLDLLTYDDLINNPFIVTNLGLDQLLLKGNGLGDLPSPPASTTTTAPGGTGTTGGTGGSGPTGPTEETAGTEPAVTEAAPVTLGLHSPLGSGSDSPPNSGPPGQGGIPIPPVFVLPPLAQQCLGNGYLSLVGSGGETFATEGDCVLFASASGAAFATGIIIPAGQSVTLDGAFFDACNELDYGYQLNFAPPNVVVDHQNFQCGGAESSVGSAAGITIGPFTTAVLLRVFLTDITCSGGTFFSDGNHAIVTGSGPWQVDIADAGGFCEAPPGGDPRLPDPPPPAGHGNLQVTVHLGP